MANVNKIQLPFHLAQHLIVDLVLFSQARKGRPLRCADLAFEPAVLLIFERRELC